MPHTRAEQVSGTIIPSSIREIQVLNELPSTYEDAILEDILLFILFNQSHFNHKKKKSRDSALPASFHMENMATLGHYIDSSWVLNNSRHVDGAGDGGALTFLTYLYTALVAISIFCFPFIFNYIATWFFFQLSHMVSKTASKVPPTVPYMIPILGSTYNFAFNGLDFVHKAT